jgi:hypothetical protein
LGQTLRAARDRRASPDATSDGVNLLTITLIVLIV